MKPTSLAKQMQERIAQRRADLSNKFMRNWKQQKKVEPTGIDDLKTAPPVSSISHFLNGGKHVN